MNPLETQLVKKLKKEINQEIEELQESVSKGLYDEIVAYKVACARIDAYKQALLKLDSAVKSLYEEEQDND